MALILSFLISSGSKKKEPRNVCPSEAKASFGLKILMTSGSKKGTQIYFLFSQKSRQTNPPHFSFPSRAPMKREACLQVILHISQKLHLSGSPVKEPSSKVTFMESLAERRPTTRALLHSSVKVLVHEHPSTYQVPFG
jgi:hypothetical protein